MKNVDHFSKYLIDFPNVPVVKLKCTCITIKKFGRVNLYGEVFLLVDYYDLFLCNLILKNQNSNHNHCSVIRNIKTFSMCFVNIILFYFKKFVLVLNDLNLKKFLNKFNLELIIINYHWPLEPRSHIKVKL